jgi:hypothetical protein
MIFAELHDFNDSSLLRLQFFGGKTRIKIQDKFDDKRGRGVTGLPDFSWFNKSKWGKMYQITVKYTKWPQNIPMYV